MEAEPHAALALAVLRVALEDLERARPRKTVAPPRTNRATYWRNRRAEAEDAREWLTDRLWTDEGALWRAILGDLLDRRLIEREVALRLTTARRCPRCRGRGAVTVLLRLSGDDRLPTRVSCDLCQGSGRAPAHLSEPPGRRREENHGSRPTGQRRIRRASGAP